MQQSDIQHPASDQEMQQVVDILAKFEPGYLPFPIFMAIARLVVFSIIEVVPVRRTQDGVVEVLLTQREADDELWPGMWHNPGVVVLASDTLGSFKDAYGRINKELGLTSEMPEPTYIDQIFQRTRRGTDSARLYYLELPAGFEPIHGTFFAINNLPDNIVETNKHLIERAAAEFEKSVI